MNRYKRMIQLEQEHKKKLEAGKGNTFQEDLELTKEDFKHKYQQNTTKIDSEMFNQIFLKRKRKHLRIIQEQKILNNKTLCEDISKEEKCVEATIWMKFILQIWEEEQGKSQDFTWKGKNTLG